MQTTFLFLLTYFGAIQTLPRCFVVLFNIFVKCICSWLAICANRYINSTIHIAHIPVVFARVVFQLWTDATVDGGPGALCRRHQSPFEALPEEVEAAHGHGVFEVSCQIGLDDAGVHAVRGNAGTCRQMNI
jgi:hypothetical protein